MSDQVAPPTGAPPPAAPPNGAPPPGAKPAGAAAAPPATVAEVDAYEELLKSKPFVVKNRQGKEQKISSRAQLEHFISKGWGATEVTEKSNRLEQELKQRDEVLKKLEAGDDVSADMLRKALGPKWKKLVEKEALRDFEEEERMKDIPPHIRERLEEAARLKSERAERDAEDQRTQAEQSQRQQQERLREVHADLQRIGIPALQKLGFTASPPAPVINRLAAYMAENIDLAAERGIAELPIEVVADAVKADMQAEYKTLAGTFVTAKDGAGLVAWLGDDVVNTIRRFDLARLRGSAGGAPPPKAPGDGPDDSDGMKKFWR